MASLLAFAAVACGQTPSIPLPYLAPHRIEIQQGNFLTQEMIAQLKPGMTKDQVRFILGTPLVADMFHANRWDYMFRRQRMNSREIEERHIVVFFEDGKLKLIEGDVVAAGAAAQQSGSAPAPSREKP